MVEVESDVLGAVARVRVMYRVRIWFPLELGVGFLVRVFVRISFRLMVKIQLRFRRRTTSTGHKAAQFTWLLTPSSTNRDSLDRNHFSSVHTTVLQVYRVYHCGT